MPYRVRPLPRAQTDVDAILDWMIHERQSRQGAAAWLNAYDEATDRLTKDPESHAFAPERDQLSRDVRQFLFKTRRGRTYRGLFIIKDDEVLILRVRGPGQPPLRDDELEEMLG